MNRAWIVIAFFAYACWIGIVGADLFVVPHDEPLPATRGVSGPYGRPLETDTALVLSQPVISLDSAGLVRAACVTYHRCAAGYDEVTEPLTENQFGAIRTSDDDYVCRKRKP